MYLYILRVRSRLQNSGSTQLSRGSTLTTSTKDTVTWFTRYPVHWPLANLVHSILAPGKPSGAEYTVTYFIHQVRIVLSPGSPWPDSRVHRNPFHLEHITLSPGSLMKWLNIYIHLHFYAETKTVREVCTVQIGSAGNIALSPLCKYFSYSYLGQYVQ